MAIVGKPLLTKHIPITRELPRVTLTMHWDTPPAGSVLLYLRRQGAPAEFAVYPPIEILGSVLTFQFDELLFQQAPGRFIGRLVIGTVDYGEVQLVYHNTVKLIDAENVNVPTCS